MKATNIKWYVEEENIADAIYYIRPDNFSKMLGMTEDEYASKTDEELNNIIIEKLHTDTVFRNMMFKLPKEVELPSFLTKGEINKEEIACWLTDEFAFCCNIDNLIIEE